ncbi:hypothetical protein M2444_002343 [Paenibacillus sp. PastF-3]|uniref:hypothetical protein n=1 Tax=Paenibacillus sp. PastF-3 TaxID=2940626 RepID=UPI002476331C|nr:hypothetical protein [Paenibacillus sp. PastF-3]MDH6370563.1 hypothetical protein [Paenibacillus sp. PastF-3]
MRKMTVLTQFIQELSYLVDRGKSYSVAEVNSHIENKDVLDWLEKEFPFNTETGLDLSLFSRPDRDYVHDALESIWGGYAGNERRKWGIENNGLCLLISWSTEIIRDTNLTDWVEETP